MNRNEFPIAPTRQQVVDYVRSNNACYIGVDYASTKPFYVAKCNIDVLDDIELIPRRQYGFLMNKKINVTAEMLLVMSSTAVMELYNKLVQKYFGSKESFAAAKCQKNFFDNELGNVPLLLLKSKNEQVAKFKQQVV